MKKKTRSSSIKRKSAARHKLSNKYQIEDINEIDYKNLPLLQKYINDRGKIIPRRVTGVDAKQQRRLSMAVKKARFLALLTTGNARG